MYSKEIFCLRTRFHSMKVNPLKNFFAFVASLTSVVNDSGIGPPLKKSITHEGKSSIPVGVVK